MCLYSVEGAQKSVCVSYLLVFDVIPDNDNDTECQGMLFDDACSEDLTIGCIDAIENSMGEEVLQDKKLLSITYQFSILQSVVKWFIDNYNLCQKSLEHQVRNA